MSPHTFLAEIGLDPLNYKEKDLQNYIIDILKESGYTIEDELVLGKGRSDIVAEQNGDYWIFEVKKELEAQYIYQALGQASSYRNYLKDYVGKKNEAKIEIVLIGLTPSNPKQYKSAKSRAEYVSQLHEDCTVIFINEDERFFPNTVSPDTYDVSFFDIIKSHLMYWLDNFIQRQKEDLFIVVIALIIVFCTIGLINKLYQITTPTDQIERKQNHGL